MKEATRHGKRYTEKEDRFIRNNRDNLSTKKIAKELGRTKKAIERYITKELTNHSYTITGNTRDRTEITKELIKKIRKPSHSLNKEEKEKIAEKEDLSFYEVDIIRKAGKETTLRPHAERSDLREDWLRKEFYNPFRTAKEKREKYNEKFEEDICTSTLKKKFENIAEVKNIHKSLKESEKFLTVDQITEIYDTYKAKISNLLAEGVLRGKKIGINYWAVRKKDIKECSAFKENKIRKHLDLEKHPRLPMAIRTSKEYMTIPQVAEQVPISAKAIKLHHIKKHLPATKIGVFRTRKVWVVEKEDFENWINNTSFRSKASSPNFLTVAEIARETGFSRRHIRAELQSRRLKGKQTEYKNTWVIKEHDLKSWLIKRGTKERDEPKFLSVKQAAEKFSIPKNTIRDNLNRNRLRGTQFDPNDVWAIREKEAERWTKEDYRGPA